MTLSPVTADVLAHAAGRHAYASLPGADRVAEGSVEPLVAAVVAEALLEDLNAEVLRHEYGHPRGVRTVRRELEALIAQANVDARRVVLGFPGTLLGRIEDDLGAVEAVTEAVVASHRGVGDRRAAQAVIVLGGVLRAAAVLRDE